MILESFLWPIAQVYRAAAIARSRGYDLGLLAKQNVGVPVLSIGNVTAGGTGKTPLTSLLIEKFRERGRRVGVVSRGYGGSERGPLRVPADGSAESARRFGDEPAWLAARHPDVPVVIGADRVAAARLLSGGSGSLQKPDLILADDAFQHRRLTRGFDVVVIDASEPEWHYRPLPLGRLREEFSALGRAQAVFLTKTNLVSSGELALARAMIFDAARAPVFEFESRIVGLAPLAARPDSPATLEPVQTRGQNVMLASGIGRPQTFKALVERDLGMMARDHFVFADHHRYSGRDLNEILARARECGVGKIVVTEKDAAKLAGCMGADEAKVFWVTRLATTAKSDLKDFYEAVDRALF